MPYGLHTEQLIEIQHTIAGNPNVTEAILFGSRAKGNQRSGSDVDIVLKGDQLTFDDILNIGVQFEESYLPFTFDVILFDHIKESELLDHIERVGANIFKR